MPYERYAAVVSTPAHEEHRCRYTGPRPKAITSKRMGR